MSKLLVVVDMQKDFVDGSLGTPEAVAIVPAVCRKIAAHNGPIVFTMDTHFEDYLETDEGRHLPVPHCIKDTEGWRLCPEVAALLGPCGGVTLEKYTFGSKDLPALAETLCPDGIESIELVGLCTDICVVSNALILKAFFPALCISVDPLCCAGVTPATHRAALDTMKMCQIELG